MRKESDFRRPHPMPLCDDCLWANFDLALVLVRNLAHVWFAYAACNWWNWYRENWTSGNLACHHNGVRRKSYLHVRAEAEIRITNSIAPNSQ